MTVSEIERLLANQGGLGNVNAYSGRIVNVLDPDPTTIHIGDVAWSLSNIPRYLGHTVFTYSVGQHCVLMARKVLADTGNAELAYAALLHDAPEAYLGDIIRPFKHLMVEYAALEAKMDLAIGQAFGLDTALFAVVKPWDTRIVGDEMRVLLPRAPQPPIEPLGIPIRRWAPSVVRSAYHRLYEQLLQMRAKAA